MSDHQGNFFRCNKSGRFSGGPRAVTAVLARYAKLWLCNFQAAPRARLKIGTKFHVMVACCVLVLGASQSVAAEQHAAASSGVADENRMAVTHDPATSAAADYQITPGDQLALKFFYTPELDQTMTVRPDGKINLPLIGDVHATEQTPGQLAEHLKTAYATTLRQPQIAIEVEKGYARQQVFIGGEVVHQGAQPLTPSLTLMRALIAAEWLKPTAAANRVLILRRAADGSSQVIKVDVAALADGKRSAAGDPLLQPYDIVLVAPSRVARLNTWIDQYIRRNLPISAGFSYSINDGRSAIGG